ncbi:MAG: caspase family protein, partial [Treponema sp.]|nr:caspase family protein [Treponema sp.]
ESLPQKKLVFLDSCHAGAVNESAVKEAGDTELKKRFENSGTAILTACREGEYSREDASLGHGVFTYSIIEGINGKADPWNTGSILIPILGGYVQQRVPQLSENKQNPDPLIPAGLAKFIVAESK